MFPNKLIYRDKMAMINKLLILSIILSLVILFSPLIKNGVPIHGGDSAFHYNQGYSIVENGISKTYVWDPITNYTGKPFSHPYAFYILEAGMIKLGISDYLIMYGLLAALSIIIDVVLIFILSKKLFGNKVAGITSLIFALSVRPIYAFFWGQWLVLFGMVFLLIFLIFLMDAKKNTRSLIFSIIALGIQPLIYPPTFLYSLAILLIYLLFVLIFKEKTKNKVNFSINFNFNKDSIKLFLIAVISIIIALPILLSFNKAGIDWGVKDGILKSLTKSFTEVTSTGYPVYWSHPEIIYNLLLIFVILGLIYAIKNRNLFLISLLVATIIVTNKTIIFYLTNLPGLVPFTQRLLIYNAIPMSILGALGYNYFSKKNIFKVLFIIALLILFVLDMRFLTSTPEQNKDMVEAALWVRDHTKQGDKIMIDLQEKYLPTEKNPEIFLSIITRRQIGENCVYRINNVKGEVRFGNVYVAECK